MGQFDSGGPYLKREIKATWANSTPESSPIFNLILQIRLQLFEFELNLVFVPICFSHIRKGFMSKFCLVRQS